MRLCLLTAMAAVMLAGAAQAQDPAQDLLDQLMEHDIHAGDDGSIDACGPVPQEIPADAPEDRVRELGNAALAHAGCIVGYQEDALKDFIRLATQAETLPLTEAQRQAATVQVNRINDRIVRMQDWSKVYLLWNVRPIVQDANERLGIDADPLGALLTQ